MTTANKLPYVNQHKWAGASWKIASCAAYALVNCLVRYLSQDWGAYGSAVPAQVLVFFQNLLGSLLFLPLFFRPQVYRCLIDHPFLHLVRVSSAVAGIVFLYLAFTYMPIAEAVALGFTGPIMTVIGAWLYLKERLTEKVLLAISLSFVGAFLIVRPDLILRGSSASLGYAALLPLASAICIAISKLMTRQLAQIGTSTSLLTMTLVVMMIPVSAVPALWQWQAPTLYQIGGIVVLACVATFAHYAMSQAYAHASVTFTTPFGFSKLIFATLLGYLCFGEWPSQPTAWIGALIILASTLILFDQHKMKKSFQ